jgi:hypothetical protein
MLGKRPDQFNIQTGVFTDHKIGVADAEVPQFTGLDNRVQVACAGTLDASRAYQGSRCQQQTPNDCRNSLPYDVFPISPLLPAACFTHGNDSFGLLVTPRACSPPAALEPQSVPGKQDYPLVCSKKTQNFQKYKRDVRR